MLQSDKDHHRKAPNFHDLKMSTFKIGILI